MSRKDWELEEDRNTMLYNAFNKKDIMNGTSYEDKKPGCLPIFTGLLLISLLVSVVL